MRFCSRAVTVLTLEVHGITQAEPSYALAQEFEDGLFSYPP